jgi:tryptophan synthase beta chain
MIGPMTATKILPAYGRFLAGEMADHELSAASLQASFAGLPEIPV